MHISERMEPELTLEASDVCNECDYGDCGGPTSVCGDDCDCNCWTRDPDSARFTVAIRELL